MNKNYYNGNTNTNYTNQNGGCGSPVPIQPQPQPCPPNPCQPTCDDDSYVVGNSVDFTIDKCDSEIKADVTVSYRDTVRVWGQIKDCSGKPVQYAYLKLIKVSSCGYVGVAHTITDCLGFYQFDICPCTDGSSFRLLVGKASTGGEEKTVSNGLQGTNCNPCNNSLTPCDCR
ncbi:MAG: hypothetical protein ACRC68_11545 [Clostridium sp.]